MVFSTGTCCCCQLKCNNLSCILRLGRPNCCASTYQGFVYVETSETVRTLPRLTLDSSSLRVASWLGRMIRCLNMLISLSQSGASSSDLAFTIWRVRPTGCCLLHGHRLAAGLLMAGKVGHTLLPPKVTRAFIVNTFIVVVIFLIGGLGRASRPWWSKRFQSLPSDQDRPGR